MRSHAQSALTTGFDACIGGLTQNGNIADQKFGTRFEQFAQTTFRTGDFFTCVEDKREIDNRFSQRGREFEHHGEPALHVG